MHIKINGEARELEGAVSVAALAEMLGLNPRQVAVERNRVIVPRSAYGEVMLAAGDEIEIVRFIGEGDYPRRSEANDGVRSHHEKYECQYE